MLGVVRQQKRFLLILRFGERRMKKTQIGPSKKWRVYMYFPKDLYFEMRSKAPTEGYTKREIYYDHHVKDYINSLLQKVSE